MSGGSLALRLIDYDGMYVPALAGTRSGEVGHPAYQHPQRLREGTYNAEVDRFSHLVIYTGDPLPDVGRRELWQRFNNGDNLLFREADFRNPGESEVFHVLWRHKDADARALVGRLILACQSAAGRVALAGRGGDRRPGAAAHRRRRNGESREVLAARAIAGGGGHCPFRHLTAALPASLVGSADYSHGRDRAGWHWRFASVVSGPVLSAPEASWRVSCVHWPQSPDRSTACSGGSSARRTQFSTTSFGRWRSLPFSSPSDLRFFMLASRWHRPGGPDIVVQTPVAARVCLATSPAHRRTNHRGGQAIGYGGFRRRARSMGGEGAFPSWPRRAAGGKDRPTDGPIHLDAHQGPEARQV